MHPHHKNDNAADYNAILAFSFNFL